MSSACLSVAVCFCGCTLIRYLVMSCSPQNPSPTSPLSPSWPMFSAPSSPMPTSSTSSDSSPIRSVAQFAWLSVAFPIFCLIYLVCPTSLPFLLCILLKTPSAAICIQQERSFQMSPVPAEPWAPPGHLWSPTCSPGAQAGAFSTCRSHWC